MGAVTKSPPLRLAMRLVQHGVCRPLIENYWRILMPWFGPTPAADGRASQMFLSNTGGEALYPCIRKPTQARTHAPAKTHTQPTAADCMRPLLSSRADPEHGGE